MSVVLPLVLPLPAAAPVELSLEELPAPRAVAVGATATGPIGMMVVDIGAGAPSFINSQLSKIAAIGS